MAPLPPFYLTAEAVERGLAAVRDMHPDITQLIKVGESRVERTDINVLRIGTGAHGSLLIGGMHAHEVVNPDLLVAFAARLCDAYANQSGLTFGPVEVSETTVRLLVEAHSIYILPLANPDGRRYVKQVNQTGWRKTRNPNPGSECLGVDLNRHWDFLFNSGIGTSDNPCDISKYRGRRPMEQPEAKAIEGFLNDHPEVCCLCDVHSHSEVVLYPWGVAPTQTSDPAMSFSNPAWDGVRQNDAVYREYMPPDDLYVYERRARAVATSINAVNGRAYRPSPIWHFIHTYRTTATVAEWAYARHLVDPSKPKIMGFAIETGTRFDPEMAEYANVVDEVSNGLITFLARCMCPIELLLRRIFGDSSEMRLLRGQLQDFRDTEMSDSAMGRRWLVMLEEHGVEVLAAIDRDPKLESAVGDLFVEAARAITTKRGAGVTLSPALLRSAGQLATRIAKSAPDLKPIIDELRPDLKKLSGQTIASALHRKPAAKR